MSDKSLTFHINNMAYTINIDTSLEKDITKYLDTNRNMSTKELLLAYLRMTQEFNNFKEEVTKISQKLPDE